MANNPLEIVSVYEFEGGDYPVLFIAKGHHDKATFAAELLAEHEYRANVDEIEHVYAHNVPCGMPRQWIIQCPAKPGRGAYLATIWEPWQWERKRGERREDQP